MSRKKTSDQDWPREWHGDVPQNKREGDFYVETIENEETFNIGQCYENEAAKLLKCKICGTTELNVGSGIYFTALRCPKCKWEQPWHVG